MVLDSYLHVKCLNIFSILMKDQILLLMKIDPSISLGYTSKGLMEDKRREGGGGGGRGRIIILLFVSVTIVQHL